MKRQIIFAAGFVLPAALAHAQSTTIGLVADWCRDYPAGRNANLCAGYVRDAVDLLANPDSDLNGGHRTCVPDTVPLKAVVGEIRSWLAANPGQRGVGVVPGAGMALRGKYPCRKGADMFDVRPNRAFGAAAEARSAALP